MSQPVWQTPAGSLGKVPEQVFYEQPLLATTNDSTQVFYRVIAGNLPAGIQISPYGTITGVPSTSVIEVQGVPLLVNRDVTSRFTIRAYTTQVIDGQTVVDSIADRTFSITVTGADTPRWITPAGEIGQYYDGGEVDFTFEYSNLDPNETAVVSVIAGSLPGGLTLTPQGRLYGYIQPLISTEADAGYDRQPYNTDPYDFVVQSQSVNYQFTLEVFDGVSSDIRQFTMFVYSKNTMTADNTQITADNTFVTADVTPARAPFLINAEPSNLGSVKSDNYFAYKFVGQDYDSLEIRYSIAVDQGYGLPPGLTLDPATGWLYGYIPTQPTDTEITYSFTVSVYELTNPSSISEAYPFSLTVTGAVDRTVTWLTPSNLGSIDNGSRSTLSVQAVATAGEALEYRLAPGQFNQLPQGLQLLPSGDIIGSVSFDTFALDNGTTTFDSTVLITRNLDTVGTTFDSVFSFTVEAFAPDLAQPIYQVERILVQSGGTGYSTVTPPELEFNNPEGADAVTAVAGTVSISGGEITAVALTENGYGYTEPAVITITDQGGGADAVLVAEMSQVGTRDVISSAQTFSVRVNRVYDKPYQNLYITAMPPFNDRAVLDQLLNDSNIFVPDYIYRSDDPNFGVADRVTYFHAYGLNPAEIEDYVASLYLNHYWKNLTLGAIETAVAKDSQGQVVYEVVYARVVDDLVNSAGQSVPKSVALPYPVPGTDISVVYPNSLINMRDQVIDVVGQYSRVLPLWMTSSQSDGRVLGFTPAWVICYTNPGRSKQIAYNIATQFQPQLNAIDFKVDRYELDRSLSINWDTVTQTWTPTASITTFDREPHYQLPNSNDSTLILSGGSGYAAGNQIRILGSQVGGQDGVNDITITVASVDNLGSIDLAFCQGTAPATVLGATFTNVSGTNISGTGVGAAFDFDVVGLDPTTFDANSMQFVVPVDMYNASDAYDKYLVFPQVNILE